MQFGRVRRSKKFNGFDISLVVLGGSTLIKKTMKWKVGEFCARRIPGFPRILFGRERQLEIRKTGSDKMADV